MTTGFGQLVIDSKQNFVVSAPIQAFSDHHTVQEVDNCWQFDDLCDFVAHSRRLCMTPAVCRLGASLRVISGLEQISAAKRVVPPLSRVIVSTKDRSVLALPDVKRITGFELMRTTEAEGFNVSLYAAKQMETSQCTELTSGLCHKLDSIVKGFYSIVISPHLFDDLTVIRIVSDAYNPESQDWRAFYNSVMEFFRQTSILRSINGQRK